MNHTTKSAQFTPGPWVVNTFIVNGQHKLEVLDATGANACVQANATLIAAAPAMYEALQALLALIGDEDLPDNGELSGASICDFARSALAQAEGRQV